MKKHLPIIVGIALPVIFIAIVWLAVYVPSSSINPKYDFIYSASGSTDVPYPPGIQYKNGYVIKDQHIEADVTPSFANTTYTYVRPKLYRYSMANGTAHEISLDDAKKLVVDPGPSSPDGYNVAYEYSQNGIFEIFGSRGNDSGYYVEKGNGRKKLAGLTSPGFPDYQRDIMFIGWIK